MNYLDIFNAYFCKAMPNSSVNDSLQPPSVVGCRNQSKYKLSNATKVTQPKFFDY